MSNQADDRNPRGCQPGQCIAVESAQVGRQDHRASGTCGGRGEQVRKVDATTDHDDAEVLALEGRHQIGFPHGIGDGGQNGDAQGDAEPARSDGEGLAALTGDAMAGDATAGDVTAVGDGGPTVTPAVTRAVAAAGTRTRSTEPS